MWSDIRFEVGVGWLEVMWGWWCVECNRFDVVSGRVWGVEDCVKCKGWRWSGVLEDCVGVIGVWGAKRL